ncbi:MFS transporter [Streptosporangium sp. NBC_01469]|uniref:MFS transporter n=1 Tax=Streptosporangium sp. NBC_01469 TaxID=2903898 RepID=UPI002E29D75E|nr:MFS transporter [Streptosporangium sp. NBC_01469]
MFQRSGILSDQGFRNLFAATATSAASVSVARIAIPLVAVMALNVGEFEVGLVSTFLTLPFLLVGLPAGVWVDRLRRRSILVLCQLGRALILFFIPVAWWMNSLSIWQLYIIVLLFGACNVFFDVAYQSYLPSLIGREKVLEGNAKLTGVQQVFAVGGPSIGGQVVGLLTAPVSFVVTSIGLAISSLCILRIRTVEKEPVRKTESRMLREIRAGLYQVRRNTRLLAIAGSTALLNLTSYAVYTVTMLFLARTLNLSPGLIGLFLSVSGVGGLLGAFVSRRISEKLGAGPAMWLILFLGSPFALALPFAGSGWTLWLAACANGITAFMTVVYNVTQVSCTQVLTPDEFLGRVNATMRFLTWSVMPIGSMLGGAAAGWLGPREALFVCAAASCLAFIPIFVSPLRNMREVRRQTRTALGKHRCSAVQQPAA